VFRGGEQPGEAGATCLWIIDYKTGAPEFGEEAAAFLTSSRERYREQLERYSQLFRSLGDENSSLPHRLALYYPMLPHMDWWPVD
jgi:hypothetical protein